MWNVDATPLWVLGASTAPLAGPTPEEQQVRAALPSRAEGLLGFLYFWGGRSAFNGAMFEQGQQLTGLDCSGLTSLLYLSLGVVLPRDASKQALAVHNVSSSAALQVGDLFFLGDPESPTQHVFHVMMMYSLQPPSLVESATNSTRILTLEQAFGYPLEALQYGMLTKGGSILTWGSVFPLSPFEYLDHFFSIKF